MDDQTKNVIGGVIIALLVILTLFFMSPYESDVMKRFGITGAAGDRWVANTSLDYPPTLPASGYSSVTYFINGSGQYAVMKFTSSGTLTVTRDFTAEVLVIGGGGGGGAGSSGGPNGGGGAGEAIYDNEVSFLAATGTYEATIGNGGVYDNAGSTTSFAGMEAEGGGKGAAYRNNGGDGACGGGGGSNTAGAEYVGGNGDPGYDGGNGSSSDTATSRSGGGGGGMGGAGGHASSGSGGAGGAGVSYSLTGASVCYAGGGGGGGGGGTGGAATCGGGQGGNCGGVAGTGQCNGTANTGGGGGGGNQTSGYRNGGTGGSGVVIITVKLDSLQDYRHPTLYYRGSHLLLTVGSDDTGASPLDGQRETLEWNGSAWVLNNSWHKGLGSGWEFSDFSTNYSYLPFSYFILNDREYVVMGLGTGSSAYPYIWDGNQWVRARYFWGTNNSVSGPQAPLGYMHTVQSADSDTLKNPSYFSWNGLTHVVYGDNGAGDYEGYTFSETNRNWTANSTIINGMATTLGGFQPRVFYNKNTAKWEYIAAESDDSANDNLLGRSWNGSIWASDTNIYKGITYTEGAYTRISSIVELNDYQIVLVGNKTGYVQGYQYNATIPSPGPHITTNFGTYAESPNIQLNTTCDGANSSYLLNITINGVNVKDSIAVQDAVVYSYSQNFSAGAWHLNVTCWNGTYNASLDSFIYQKLNKTGGTVLQEDAVSKRGLPVPCDFFSECSDAGSYVNGSVFGYPGTGANVKELLWDGRWGVVSGENAYWISGDNPGYINITYVKPTNASGVVTWIVQDTNGSQNLTIAASCWSLNATHLKLFAKSYYHATAGNRYSEWGCYNSSGEVSLRKNLGGYSLYEEAIWWNVTPSEYPPSTTPDTNISIWNGTAWIPYNTSNKMSFRCGNPPVICQPTNQNNATSQPILLNVNNGTGDSTYQTMLGNTSWTTAELRCGTNATGPLGTGNINVTTTLTNYSTSTLAASANQSIYCFLNVTSVGATFPRSFNLSVVNN